MTLKLRKWTQKSRGGRERKLQQAGLRSESILHFFCLFHIFFTIFLYVGLKLLISTFDYMTIYPTFPLPTSLSLSPSFSPPPSLPPIFSLTLFFSLLLTLFLCLSLSPSSLFKLLPRFFPTPSLFSSLFLLGYDFPFLFSVSSLSAPPYLLM